jgi:general secretion pathway protein A
MLLEYYGFSAKPFELSPDLKFLFLTPGYRIALEAVCRGITDRKGLIILSGEVGTGKTMLIYSVMEKLPPTVKTAFIFHSTYNFGELLQQIFFEMEESTPRGGIVELKNQFLLYLEKLKSQGELLAIFLDEAQKFSKEVLEGLFSILGSELWVSETLQIILIGQPEIEEGWRNALLRYGPKFNPLRVTINPLSKEESLEYIEHRMKTVGRPAADIFSPQALALILEKAGGIPRLINVFCDNALFAGYRASVKRIEVNLVKGIIKNLEGPDDKPYIRKKPPSKIIPSRLSLGLFIRDGLIVIFGFTFVVGVFLLRPELTDPLTKFKLKWFGGIKPLLTGEGRPVNKTQSPKEYQKNTVKIDLTPEGHKTPGIDLNLEGHRTRGEEKSQKIQVPGPTVHTIQVKEGDYLSKLVLSYYGKLNESLIDLVLTHNPSLSNVDLVLVDQQIKFPEIKEDKLIVPAPDQYFRVHLGTFESLMEANQFKKYSNNITVSPKKVSPRQTWYRVEAGPYKDKTEALEIIKRLREKKLLPFF